MLKGLLLKEWYLIWNNFRVYLLLILVFCAAGVFSDNTFLPIYMAVLLGMIPVNLISFDEKCHWDLYACTLPCPKRLLVTTKYLILLCSVLFEITVIALMRLISFLTTGEADLAGLMVWILLILLISVLSTAVMLPFAFRFGSDKGRVFYILTIMVICVLAAGLAAAVQIEPVIRVLGTIYRFLPFLVAAFCVLALAVSWRLSVRFYERREW